MNPLTFKSAPLLNRHVLLSMPVIGAVIGVMGPFESYGTMGFGERVGHFALCVTLIGAMVMTSSYYIARRFFQGYWPVWVALCLDLLLTIPGAVIILGSLSLFAPDSLGEIHPLDLLWQNLVMMLAFRASSLLVSWRRVREGPQAASSLEQKPSPDEIARRMPFGLRGESILALSSEDHYLRVHTPRGEALILMALSHAVPLMDDGFLVHRSHWVAREAIKSANSTSVKLVTGLSVPISRHRAKEFRSWLDEQRPDSSLLAAG
jgi:hypothetical protein